MAEVVEVLVPGGKATAGPPLGPSLGPLGINVKAVVDEINKKTASFNGMQVPGQDRSRRKKDLHRHGGYTAHYGAHQERGK